MDKFAGIMRELIASSGSRYGAGGITWCNRRAIHILNSCRTPSVCAILVICLVHLSFVQAAVSGVNHNEFLAQLKVPQCRKDCIDKVSAILLSYEMSSFRLVLLFPVIKEIFHLVSCK